MKIINQVDLFKHSENNYHTYRIPSLLTLPDRILLAFCEGRKNSASDFGNIDLVMKRSEDNGRSWSAVRILWANGGAIQNPCPIFDKTTGNVFLHTLVNRRDHFIMTSSDKGFTWSTPQLIPLRKPTWTLGGPCPGHGIQLSSGRMLVPGVYNTGDARSDKDWGSYFVFSDDHGKTWQLGHDFGEGTNEFLCEELNNHSIYSILRPNNAKDTGNTRISISEDCGGSFPPTKFHPDLIGPICQASILRVKINSASNINEKTGSELFLYCKPDHPIIRKHITIKSSSDNGVSWKPFITLFKGKSAYSDMAQAQDGTIFCLYERGRRSYRDMITLSIISDKTKK
jgi:sialidase-1